MTLRLSRLDKSFRIAEPDGSPTLQFIRFWQNAVEAIEQAFSDIVTVNEQQQGAIEAIEAAQAAADAANTAAEAAQTAADGASAVVDQIATGTLDLDAVTIGGTRFINNGGILEPEP